MTVDKVRSRPNTDNLIPHIEPKTTDQKVKSLLLELMQLALHGVFFHAVLKRGLVQFLLPTGDVSQQRLLLGVDFNKFRVQMLLLVLQTLQLLHCLPVTTATICRISIKLRQQFLTANVSMFVTFDIVWM